ncbi:GAF domain-containing sensor histidine kinase [Paenalkalicoccus suaedae]|uniref:histidine kinase n=1 Tax=Paenalkalicoccus suaedae TaxID=2592382 RepID=A0A859FCG3_9BACI|nr:GAF domain-containing sensor histidine kinase [Paenalkalicoccus suaedae]QKS69955.1 GAF domain-containing sensor histidine kinase [Paenalkalicoccus suaedae]
MEQIRSLQLLKTIAESGNAGTDIQEMLHDMLNSLLQLIDGDAGWIFLFDELGRHQLVADQGLPEALLSNHKERMCGGDCHCLSKERKGFLTDAVNVMECKRLEDAKASLEETNGLTYHASVPLKAGPDTIGLLNIASRERDSFSQEELEVLQAVCYQMGTAVRRIQLTEQQVAKALQDQKRHLAADLHDSVQQLLFSLSLTAKGALSHVKDEKAKEIVEHLQTIAKQASVEMKQLVYGWHSQNEAEHNLRHQLAHYAERIGLQVDVEIEEGVLSKREESVLLRIGQEALNNVKKHARVEEACIRVVQLGDKVHVMIQDEGQGFDVSKATTSSIGLISMKERALSIGGDFTIVSSREGTRIEVVLAKRKGETTGDSSRISR